MNDHIPTDFSGDAILKERDRPIHLKLSFLLPLGLVFFSLIFSFVYLTFDRSQRQIAAATENDVTSITSMFRHNILENSNMMEAVSHALLRNIEIEAALKEKSRSKLLSLSSALFNELSKEHLITHFYYHDVDRTNLLRVHKPERFGDKINRFTMIESESLGAVSSGIELGILGTFTLRHVTPWYDSNQQLLGYLELGMEIDGIFESIEQLYNTHLFMLIHKKYLDKGRWIEGMRMLGHIADWDTFDQFVVTNLRSGQSLPDEFIANLATPEAVATGEFNLNLKGLRHRARMIPIEDKGKRDVGDMWILLDTENELEDSLKVTLIATAIATTLGLILFVLFFRLVGGIESELSKHQKALRQIATNDGLTGVYNRRSFDTIVDKEVERARRYERDLSLMIIDIDHFKQINDTFGHVAGDAVLKALAEKLSEQLRSNDHLARYGGEEFVIILPETPLEMAQLLAERVRKSAGEHEYQVGNNQTSHLTLSIGVSSFPEQASTVEELTFRADSALYEAKETGRNRVCIFNSESKES
ncbi:GGDEF domain-containing protein [Pseudomonadota bacterium]